MKNYLNKILISLFVVISTGFSQDNYSLSFDGVDDYVDLGDLPSGLNSFSYTGWYKRSDPHNEGQPIINTPNGMVTISGGGQKIYASAYQSRNGTAPIFELETTNFGLQDEWNHFSFVVDSDIHSLFINGELVDSEADEYDFQSVYGLSQIGSHGRSNGPNDSFFNGSLDEISVWDRALTQEEIQIYYGNSPNGSEDGLIAHYDFNGGEGNTLTDLSGNGNNGTINGATWSGDVPAPPVFGCTDSYADNFNSEATSDDGSCYYPDNGEYVLSFNGSGAHVNFGTDPSTELSGDITLAAWIKFDNFNNNNAAVISKVSDGSPIAYGIEKKNSQNKISFWIGDGNSFNEVYYAENGVIVDKNSKKKNT